MIAIVNIRTQPAYRRDAFVAGLNRVGYSVVQGGKPRGPEDLLVLWNKYDAQEQLANTWERAGGSVIVCENGYIGADAKGRQLYAIAIGGHNGSGTWPIGDEDRLAKLGIELKPYRIVDGYILVCGQRAIGSKEMAAPKNWHPEMARRIARGTERQIKIREHPGNKPAKVALDDDLAGAFACVIWSSGAGVKALASGVPVFYDAPRWVCEDAAWPVTQWLGGVGPNFLQGHVPDYRPQAMHAMSYAQWEVDEISAGEPFARILESLTVAC